MRLLVEDQIETGQGDLLADIPKRTNLVHGSNGELHDRAGKTNKGKNPLEEIAIGITALIRNGFPPDYAMSLTPRQIAAYLDFNERLDALERAGDLMVAAVGAQGDQKALDKMLKQLTGQWR